MEIAGKKALVVGGASGFGRASAQLLRRLGAHIAIIDRPESAGAEVAASLAGPFFDADVTDFARTESALHAAGEALGGLHITVTTAGGARTPDGVYARRTLGRDGPHDLEAFRYVVDLNAVATFNVSRLAADWMSRNEPEDEERGVIINTASIAAFEGQIGQVAYTAGKAAIAAMCLTMARDLGGFGIRVLAIAPSLFLTGPPGSITEDVAKELVRDAAFPRRGGRPEEYARLVQAIVENPMLNGQSIRLDAGIRMAPR